jgi:hypothetical protein
VNPRIEDELELLRGWFGDRLDYLTHGHWVLLREFRIPVDLWTPALVELTFQIPEGIPGQAPYGFHVRPGVALVSGGAVNNYNFPTSNPWGDGWGTFSWQLEEWRPAASVCDGSNVLDFARSLIERFRQGA